MSAAATPPRQILVATDLSQRAGVAVTRPSQLSRENGALLTALPVLPVEAGTGARSPVSHALLGSVANQVMRQSQSNVLVVSTVNA